MSTQPPGSDKQIFYDEKHRKIISKKSLVCAPESSSITNEILSSPQDETWTQHGWQRAGSAHIPQTIGKGKKAWRNPQGKQLNRLQKKLQEALAKPVQLTKAESMMQKMGWQGGALGKTGTGIMEPVAPNAAYAIKTRGFGQATHTPDPPLPKKKKIKQQKISKKKNHEIFHENVLQQIFQFVKNDSESEIAFDKHLSKGERKQIHNLVNEVINENDVASLGSIALMDLVQEIQAHNYYVLCTESQGTFPDRFLCLFKEAPEHVYLITPKDLRKQSDDVDELDKNNEENISNETQDSVNKDLKDTSISNEIVKEVKAIVDENVITESNEPINDVRIIDKDGSNNLKKSENENAENDSLKESANIDENVKERLKDTNESISKDSGGTENIDVTEKLIEYFKEFAESEDYSELRFLGPFTEAEMDHINNLISNLYYHVNHNEDNVKEKYKELLKSLDEERYIFEVKEDINWSPVIHKTDSYKGKRISTKDHLFFDTEEL